MRVIVQRLAAAALLSCGAACAGFSRREVCGDFNELPRPRQHAEFRAYAPERQLDVYLCMMDREPPASEFADDIAERGPEVLPFVMARLKSAGSEAEQADIIYVLEVMSDRGDLAGRADVAAEAGEAVSKMRLKVIRETCEERLKRIQINSHLKPFTYTVQ